VLAGRCAALRASRSGSKQMRQNWNKQQVNPTLNPTLTKISRSETYPRKEIFLFLPRLLAILISVRKKS
jgi:hypothetical protein